MCSVDVMENHHNSNQQCQQLSLQLNSKRWVQNSTGWSIPFNIVQQLRCYTETSASKSSSSCSPGFHSCARFMVSIMALKLTMLGSKCHCFTFLAKGKGAWPIIDFWPWMIQFFLGPLDEFWAFSSGICEQVPTSLDLIFTNKETDLDCGILKVLLHVYTIRSSVKQHTFPSDSCSANPILAPPSTRPTNVAMGKHWEGHWSWQCRSFHAGPRWAPKH